MSEFTNGPQPQQPNPEGPQQREYRFTNQPIPPHLQQHNVVGNSPLAPKPPKKRHIFRNIMLIVGGLFALLIVAAVLSPGTPAKDAAVTPPVAETSAVPSVQPSVKPSVKPSAPRTTKPVEQAPKVACAGQEDRNAPCTIQVGKPFQLGKHTVQAGWKVTSEYDTMSIVGKAKNTSSETSTMFIDIKFLKGSDVVAVVSCNTSELEPGQTQAMNCFGTDTFTKQYDHVTAEASF